MSILYQGYYVDNCCMLELARHTTMVRLVSWPVWRMEDKSNPEFPVFTVYACHKCSAPGTHALCRTSRRSTSDGFRHLEIDWDIDEHNGIFTKLGQGTQMAAVVTPHGYDSAGFCVALSTRLLVSVCTINDNFLKQNLDIDTERM